MINVNYGNGLPTKNIEPEFTHYVDLNTDTKYERSGDIWIVIKTN